MRKNSKNLKIRKKKTTKTLRQVSVYTYIERCAHTDIHTHTHTQKKRRKLANDWSMSSLNNSSMSALENNNNDSNNNNNDSTKEMLNEIDKL